MDGFNFRRLIEELLADNLPAEILWFGARLRLYDQSDEIKRKSTEAINRLLSDAQLFELLV